MSFSSLDNKIYGRFLNGSGLDFIRTLPTVISFKTKCFNAQSNKCGQSVLWCNAMQSYVCTGGERVRGGYYPLWRKNLLTPSGKFWSVCSKKETNFFNPRPIGPCTCMDAMLDIKESNMLNNSNYILSIHIVFALLGMWTKCIYWPFIFTFMSVRPEIKCKTKDGCLWVILFARYF